MALNKTQVNSFLENLQLLNDFPVDGKFQMINLLKFKDKVDDSGTTGKQAYLTYMKAAIPFFSKINARIIYDGYSQLTLIGPDKEWDKILIVEYDSKADFMNMIQSDDYPLSLRSQALEDSRLILSRPL
jgi:uncharacterized protein (DUF1330 family)